VYFVIYIEFFPYCLFVSNSQVIGCEDHLRNDLYCVGWGVKLYSIQSKGSGRVVEPPCALALVSYVQCLSYHWWHIARMLDVPPQTIQQHSFTSLYGCLF